jgi:hypothetical protein
MNKEKEKEMIKKQLQQIAQKYQAAKAIGNQKSAQYQVTKYYEKSLELFKATGEVVNMSTFIDFEEIK